MSLAPPEHHAKEMLKIYWDKQFPVNPLKIATETGIKVLYDEQLGHYSGQALLDCDSNPLILLNEKEPLARQRFTCAHEFGHHTLGHITPERPRLDRDTHKDFHQGYFDVEERDANLFAAYLLMPTDPLLYFIDTKKTSLEDVTKIFGVSMIALRIRLQRIGYYGWEEQDDNDRWWKLW